MEFLWAFILTICWIGAFGMMMEGKAGGFSFLVASNLICFSLCDIDDMSEGDFVCLFIGIFFLFISFISASIQKQENEERKRKISEMEEKEKKERELERERKYRENMKKAEEQRKKREQLEKERVERVYREKALKIYKKCVEKNILNIDNAENEKALEIIASMYEVKDIECAKKMFEEGKEKAFEYAREASCGAYEEMLEFSKLIGKEKYKKLCEDLKNNPVFLRYAEDKKIFFELLKEDREMLNDIEERVIDELDQNEKFKLLEFTNINYEINNLNNFEISFDYKLKDEIKIINSPGILDGVLEINVYDAENKLVANGIYNPVDTSKIRKTSDNKFDFDAVGFEENGRVFCICVSKNYSEINTNNKYHIEISPIHLWIIEK